MRTCFLVFALWPEIPKKAQAQLDAVVGPTRLPEYDDRDSLPYLNAIFKEVICWVGIAPVGTSPSISVSHFRPDHLQEIVRTMHRGRAELLSEEGQRNGDDNNRSGGGNPLRSVYADALELHGSDGGRTEVRQRSEVSRKEVGGRG